MKFHIPKLDNNNFMIYPKLEEVVSMIWYHMHLK